MPHNLDGDDLRITGDDSLLRHRMDMQTFVENVDTFVLNQLFSWCPICTYIRYATISNIFNMRTLFVFDKFPLPVYSGILQFRQCTHDYTDGMSRSQLSLLLSQTVRRSCSLYRECMM